MITSSKKKKPLSQCALMSGLLSSRASTRVHTDTHRRARGKNEHAAPAINKTLQRRQTFVFLVFLCFLSERGFFSSVFSTSHSTVIDNTQELRDVFFCGVLDRRL